MKKTEARRILEGDLPRSLPQKIPLASLPRGQVHLRPLPVPKLMPTDPITALGEAASADETRYILTGVHIDEGLAIATDGTVLVAVPYSGPLKAGGTYATGLGKSWNPQTGQMEKIAQGTPLDGTFPRCKQVIPGPKDLRKTTVPIGDHQIGLILAAARAAKLVETRDHIRSAPIAACIDGHAFNPHHVVRVIRALRRCGHADLQAIAHTESGPLTIRSRTKPAFGLVMPLRVPDANGPSWDNMCWVAITAAEPPLDDRSLPDTQPATAVITPAYEKPLLFALTRGNVSAAQWGRFFDFPQDDTAVREQLALALLTGGYHSHDLSIESKGGKQPRLLLRPRGLSPITLGGAALISATRAVLQP